MVGRHALSNAERREKPLRIRLAPPERKEIDDAADATSLATSSWARMVLLREARKAAKKEK
jgi:uncharacterized protein (DUF1778 family)